MIDSRRQPAHDLVRQLERRGMTHLEGRRVIHGRDLPADRIGYLLPAVTRVDTPETGAAVEDLPIVRSPVMHTGRAREQAWARLELAIGGEWHPEGFELGPIEAGVKRHGVLP